MNNNDEKVRLRVLGVSYAMLKKSAFMLILQQVDGPLHLNMWIGEAEANAIAVAMEGIRLPRPLTHDLFTSFIHGFGVRLEQVYIYNEENDIFLAEMQFSDGERTISLDARTSDAIAIAMRMGAPIFTNRKVLDSKGFVLDIRTVEDSGEESSAGETPRPADPHPSDSPHGNTSPRLENYSIEELQRSLQKAIDNENYEDAARISAILRHKQGDTETPVE